MRTAHEMMQEAMKVLQEPGDLVIDLSEIEKGDFTETGHRVISAYALASIATELRALREHFTHPRVYVEPESGGEP